MNTRDTLNYTYRGHWVVFAVAVLLSTRAGQGAITTDYIYDQNKGDVTQTFVHNGNGITYSKTDTGYDALGRQSSVTRWADLSDASKGLTTEYTYDVAGNMVTQAVKTGGGDFETVYVYDDLGRQVTVTGPSTSSSGAATTIYAYDVGGNVVTQKVKLDSEAYAETRTEYDALNRATKVYDPENNYRTSIYDSQGRAITQYAFEYVDGTNDITREQARSIYDGAGRVVSKIRMLLANSNSAEGVTTDNVVVYDYDTAGRLAAQTSYNMGSNTPLSTTSEYDGHGRLTKTTDPKGFWTFSAYNETGLVTLRQEYDGDTREFSMAYDGDNRLTRSIAVGDEGTPNLTTWYAYDDLGRRTKVTDPKLYDTVYTYDLLGRQVMVIEDAGGLARTTEYIYSKQGLLATQIADNGDEDDQLTIYTYDPAGRVATITYPENDAITFTYYPNGAVSTRKLQDGAELEYKYDDRGLLVTKKTPGSNDYLVRYEYDGLGRMIAAVKATGEEPESDTAYFYDDLSRVTCEYQWVHDAGNTKTLHMEYDQAGNRTRLMYPALSN